MPMHRICYNLPTNLRALQSQVQEALSLAYDAHAGQVRSSVGNCMMQFARRASYAVSLTGAPWHIWRCP